MAIATKIQIYCAPGSHLVSQSCDLVNVYSSQTQQEQASLYNGSLQTDLILQHDWVLLNTHIFTSASASHHITASVSLSLSLSADPAAVNEPGSAVSLLPSSGVLHAAHIRVFNPHHALNNPHTVFIIRGCLDQNNHFFIKHNFNYFFKTKTILYHIVILINESMWIYIYIYICICVTLDHKTSHKGQFLKIEMYIWINKTYWQKKLKPVSRFG